MRSRLARLAALLAVGVLTGALAGGCAVNGSVVATEQERRTIPADEAPFILVETFNGRISVQGGADPVVEVRITRRGSGTSQDRAERDLENVRIDVETAPDRIAITARRTGDPSASPGNSGADLEVIVPAGASVELRTSNGRVEAANVTGSIVVRTSNGSVTTRGGHDLDLDTTNGDVSVNGPEGRLRVSTSNGGIDILSARDVVLSARTSNAAIVFSGTLAPGSHALATTNGDCSISLPGDAAFAIEGTTTNGTVRTDFPALTLTDATIAGETAPAPAVRIVAATTNGDLSVLTQLP